MLFGIESGAVLCFVLAATYPERTSSVVVFGAIARGAWDPDYPWGWTEEQFDSWIDKEQREWGSPGFVRELAAHDRADARARSNDLL